ncbi:MAG: thioredoxin [Kiritimatiellaeota bacterium]|nr:thioredoxin [Kiritimatiellota bacterium]
MSQNLLTLTAENFDATIAEGVTLVDLWAPWCGPCQMLGPILDNQVAPAVAGRAKVGKVNIDESRDIAVKFGVKSIPTILIFKDGQLLQTMVGLQSGDALIKAVEAILAS